MLTDKEMLEIAEKYIDFLSREYDTEYMFFPEYIEKKRMETFMLLMEKNILKHKI